MLLQSMVSQSMSWALMEIIKFKEKCKNPQIFGGKKWKNFKLYIHTLRQGMIQFSEVLEIGIQGEIQKFKEKEQCKILRRILFLSLLKLDVMLRFHQINLKE